MAATATLPRPSDREIGIAAREFSELRARRAFAMDVELAAGVIRPLMPESALHGLVIQLALDWLRGTRREGAFALSNVTVELEPRTVRQPDIMVVSTEPQAMDSGFDIPAKEVLLAIEVSVSTLTEDRGPKLADYARASIPEYWIVDVARRQLEIRREPEGNDYRQMEVAQFDGEIRPLFAPDSLLLVSELFPKSKA